MPKISVPPLKCQGIKTKIVPLILANALPVSRKRWLEPFLGSGVVALNAKPSKALLADLNPHLIAFYTALQNGAITPEIARAFLEKEGAILREKGEGHYYAVRERFNAEGRPLDFLFLSRACFNGMIRFNRKGAFNVPFCRKPERFAKAYITKIVNQVAAFQETLRTRDWRFDCRDFEETIGDAGAGDLIYCDPPYIGRHVDYFSTWSLDDELRLHKSLSRSRARFILSTWHSNAYRSNDALTSIWKDFHVVTRAHFYHVGASEENRNEILEALVMNFAPKCSALKPEHNSEQIPLFDLSAMEAAS